MQQNTSLSLYSIHYYCAIVNRRQSHPPTLLGMVFVCKIATCNRICSASLFPHKRSRVNKGEDPLSILKQKASQGQEYTMFHKLGIQRGPPTFIQIRLKHLKSDAPCFGKDCFKQPSPTTPPFTFQIFVYQ